MASISNIAIKNFRTYRDVEVDFDSATGVYLLSGDNGAGKSTFLNAINWCLYGDTPFQSIGQQHSVVSDTAGPDEETSVRMYITVGNKEYLFRRTTRGGGATRGTLAVSEKIGEEWLPIDSAVAAPQAVRRVLPEELRHLFFFNGEQLRDIYTSSGKKHSLRDNVYQVTEIDILDTAVAHLAKLEEKILRRIQKNNKFATQIEAIKNDITSSEAWLKQYEQNVAELTAKRAEIKQKINDLDLILNETAEARVVVERRDSLDKELTRINTQISEKKDGIQSMIQKTLPQALLHDKFGEYYDALINAKEQSLIPPPIDPKITHQILKTGVCICGEKLSTAARKRIEEQNEEYNRRKELQHLTDGISTYERMDYILPEFRHQFSDLQGELIKLEADRENCGRELKATNEQLARLDDAVQQLEQNPDVSRSNYVKAQERTEISLREALDAQSDTKKALDASKSKLNELISKDTSTQQDETLRQKVEALAEKIRAIKQIMEKLTREKLEAKTWKTFSKILPESTYSGLEIDETYNIILKSYDGHPRSVNMAAAGEVKVLGLSLVSALSTNLGGYDNVPLLIDNLYGDLSETHFSELTDMVSELSQKKQIMIMNLDIERVESEFENDVVKGRYRIIKNPVHGTEITRYFNE